MLLVIILNDRKGDKTSKTNCCILFDRKMREKENKKLQKYFYQVSAPLIPTKD
jgi:hypothetical protein